MLYDTLVAAARKGDALDDIRFAALTRGRALVDLLDRQLQQTRALRLHPLHDQGGYGKHEAALRATDREIDRRLELCGDAEGRDAVLCLLLAARFDEVTLWQYRREVGALVARVRGWTPAEVAVMIERVFEYDMDFWCAEALGEVLTAAERLDAEGVAAVAPWLHRAHKQVLELDAGAHLQGSLTKRLRSLLAGVDPAVLPEGLVPGEEPWAAPLRERPETPPGRTWADFVRHLAGLSSPRPSGKWRRTCVSLIDEAGARAAAAECLRLLGEGEPLCSREHGSYADWASGDYHYHYLVHQNHRDLARGAVWAATLTGGPEAVPLLGALALRAGADRSGFIQDLKLAGAAINALGAVEDPAALAELGRLQAKIKDRALRKQIGTALLAAAERQGITAEQLVERSVPAHGLGPDGALERKFGEHVARIAIEDAATVRLTFTGADGRASRTAPAAVKDGFAGELKELKALAKEIRGTLSGERARVEAIMSDGARSWPFAEWREHYRDHPVTGAVARGLIWEFQGEDGTWRAAMESPDGGAVNVRLWHPARAALDEVRSWRERVMDARVRQPFKQAFREIYLLTPAEEETGTYSNRFAAHIVHYRRLYALFKERGWQSNFLGSYDGGHDGEARGEFGGGAWRACFYHEPAEGGFDHGPEYAATDQVRFERRQGRRWERAPLAEVPPLVFSEAMRNVDLFVGVTSIAADPAWTDRGEDRYAAYWRAATFGELTASAEVRRAALERILPRTRIADRCSLDGRYLVVRGDLRTYRIHLGSANVLMEPDGAYLCIVRGGRTAGGTVFLPFEDERLSLILSKAFLLAADARISDETILRQLSPSR
ncbi:DUF4132 domain-containing protein [Actinomadura nitritigenes]|uniref:DUF4132 domain-containing protein n=1 Tax=Actinomadura nitritigenes TaxID=134602 RepID=A0ABS3QQ84_9ACTN|nr:DUF4132 domain-containing protein [Actinomadura nitritigenes]MBO2436144.1 DUF4132 domain-containing protein [Actinomadura nitritigenes]